MKKKRCLLIVDVQNDFMHGGALAVPDAEDILKPINHALCRHKLAVATQDWHPAGHGSFAANHPGRAVFETIDLNGLPQVLWPVHCVQHTGGALFAPGLRTDLIDRVFVKGTDPEVDSYSGFFDNGRRKDTGLAAWLREQGVTALDVCGVATDYCVKFTVLDALAEGFEVNLLTEACRGVELQEGDIRKALAEMHQAGATMTFFNKPLVPWE
ncbi:bifunctional nicotinamidase/pyrazinamidase [Luteolibacter sp. LG18]|uniref:bifunctional nicotinamidase/pyrazinamidase n=1 Tax=Luteolibacter sp. LG18 TaxID=2819286 RepID=UPI002B2CC0EB|nr:nicotinamidase/pyrazinamidase [Luteolibacter sp. LG18]